MLEQKTSKRQTRVKDREKSREDNVTSRKDKQKTVRLFLSFVSGTLALDFRRGSPGSIYIKIFIFQMLGMAVLGLAL